MLSELLGITINKSIIAFTPDHYAELKQLNIGVHDNTDKYILYYMNDPSGSSSKSRTHLKWLLTQVRNDDIYNSYNKDFGLHVNPK